MGQGTADVETNKSSPTPPEIEVIHLVFKPHLDTGFPGHIRGIVPLLGRPSERKGPGIRIER
ncbi:MAG: hypothetical protein QOJ59_1179 [Thermomicrobiales bacterium]|jgi:hypothetical protein|nr:hypothetical protein [Thermomicrobiales bacterium]